MLKRDVSLLPMPVTPPGQPVFVYGVIVHRTGAFPSPAAGTNHPSSRTPSDIVTAISRQPAADAGAAPNARKASTTHGRPLRSPIAAIVDAAPTRCRGSPLSSRTATRRPEWASVPHHGAFRVAAS